jgi:hypothetical protein
MTTQNQHATDRIADRAVFERSDDPASASR